MIALVVIGGILFVVGWIMTVAVAFREHTLWGVAALFVPFGAFLFSILHWRDAQRGFLVMAGGFGMFMLVGVIGPLVGYEPSFVKHEPVAKEQPVAPAPAPAAETPAYLASAEPPPSYTPPAPAPAVEAPPERPMIQQVYADNATQTYYSADCKQRPPNAYRVARSAVVRQGFKEAPCP